MPPDSKNLLTVPASAAICFCASGSEFDVAVHEGGQPRYPLLVSVE